MLAYVAVCGLPLLVAPNLLPLGAALATPFVFLRDVIVQKTFPYFRWGYLGVVVFGPIAIFLLFFAQGVPGVSGEEQAGVFFLGLFAFELMAVLITVVYVALWRVGDRWFAPGPGWGARARRLALAVVIAAGGALYVPAMYRWNLMDACLDSGGRMGTGFACEH